MVDYDRVKKKKLSVIKTNLIYEHLGDQYPRTLRKYSHFMSNRQCLEIYDRTGSIQNHWVIFQASSIT